MHFLDDHVKCISKIVILFQQQPSSRQIVDDFRTSLQMPHLTGAGPGVMEQAQQSALLQQHLYGHHLREEQRRALESQQQIAQQRERLAQEQQRVMAMAQAAEHQHKAALLTHQLALAQAANQQYRDHLAAAAVIEHQQRSLARAQAQSEAQRQAALTGLGVTTQGVGGYLTPLCASPAARRPTPDTLIKAEPKSPLISPSVQMHGSSKTTGNEGRPLTLPVITEMYGLQ